MSKLKSLSRPEAQVSDQKLIKGRGATSNLAGRYETQMIETVDDGWWQDKGGEENKPRLDTLVTFERARSILSRNQSPDLPFSVSLNPYRGCEHGCVYCFARPTHAYLGLSPGFDFESRIFAKTNAPQLLSRELARPNYQPLPIALGINTDAYQPCERELKLARQCLNILHQCRHPTGLITKSALIERDLDLLTDMARDNLLSVAITLTTLDHELSRKLEPRAASPLRRLKTIRRLTDAGIPVSVSIAPVIPFITEQEMEQVLSAAAEAGAVSANYIVLRLPWEVNPLFQDWLQTHFPDRAERVMNRIRDMRGGKDYDASFGNRMKGEGMWADLIRQRFQRAIRKLELGGGRLRGLDTSLFRRPDIVAPADKTPGTGQGQMDFFG